MSSRIIEMRHALFNLLKEKGTPGDWSHIIRQIGMFTYTGLQPSQCEQLTNVNHIYLLKNGRISMAGLNSKNVKYVADAIHNVVTAQKL
jgi:aspartate aminotransferase